MWKRHKRITSNTSADADADADALASSSLSSSNPPTAKVMSLYDAGSTEISDERCGLGREELLPVQQQEEQRNISEMRPRAARRGDLNGG